MATGGFGYNHDGNSNIAQQQREIEQPVICPECGSTWFTEQIYQQYSDLAYGGGAGADLRVINVTPQTIRVCLCGHPYTPNLSGIRGRVATGEMENFKISLQGAHDKRKKAATPAVSMTQVTQGFTSVKETEALASKVEALTGMVNATSRELENVRFIADSAVAAAAVATEPVKVSTTATGKGLGAATKTTTATKTSELL